MCISGRKVAYYHVTLHASSLFCVVSKKSGPQYGPLFIRCYHPTQKNIYLPPPGTIFSSESNRVTNQHKLIGC